MYSCTPHFANNKIVFLSFDGETGGEHCGILQISTETLRIDVDTKKKKNGESAAGDTAKNAMREPVTFNDYVNPGEGAIIAESPQLFMDCTSAIRILLMQRRFMLYGPDFAAGLKLMFYLMKVLVLSPIMAKPAISSGFVGKN